LRTIRQRALGREPDTSWDALHRGLSVGTAGLRSVGTHLDQQRCPVMMTGPGAPPQLQPILWVSIAPGFGLRCLANLATRVGPFNEDAVGGRTDRDGQLWEWVPVPLEQSRKHTLEMDAVV